MMSCSILISIFLLSLACTTVYGCECQNGGKCDDKVNSNCICEKGFYGPICSEYADSYTLMLKETPKNLNELIKNILGGLAADYRINDTIQVPNGNVFKLMFYKKLTAKEIEEISRVILTFQPGIEYLEGQETLSDFNECVEGPGKQKCFGASCVNTYGSFKCGCNEGEQVNSDNKCVKKNDDNRTVIYIWSAVVVAVVLVMIALIIFYRWKKVEKGKKIQRQMEKKSHAFNPTNMDDFDGTMRRSPMGSVFDAPLGGPPMGGRPNSEVYNLDGTSLYSYPGRMYSQSELDLNRHRLSAPILENYVNGGYEGDRLSNPLPSYTYGYGPGNLYATSPTGSNGYGLGPQYSTSPSDSMQQFPSKNSEPGLTTTQEADRSYHSADEETDVIPTSFASDVHQAHHDQYAS